ncbi:non-hydrolyzing UDP-N-acetylglucosamine 2-epimerase [Methylomicrobium lacus]|uniref:non-hydrolyzing UDP-N-acetylglucosamine 2-epimerase n=1 Tax=Methylomicrobium lacus TaxID=136992 RepID=UPI0004A235FD|nr:UDP-N-acetylglucosamine 2-epimerase (non-hydrolyzing) [Methylomicrobium lacus]
MNKKIKLLIIAGARPNFMKVAPIIQQIRRHSADVANYGTQLEYRLIHTGQHYDEKMSHIFFDELGISAPDINLGVGSGSHAEQTANVMTQFEPICLQEKPDWVVVVGDVNSTMACTLVCAKLGIKVAHVEAGLRSFDRSMPEEVNRIVTDALADLLLTPSVDGDENLKREGIPDWKIDLVGNVMIDALTLNLEKARASQVLKKLQLKKKSFVYVTLHRPSNVDEKVGLTTIMYELKRIADDIPVVFPMHPRTRKMCGQYGISLDNNKGLRILEPIGYHDSLCLTEMARFILTDSGGLQEESTYFRTPCLTLRPNTERPITVTLGSNKLTNIEVLASDINEVLNRRTEIGQIPPYWDGRTSERIVASLIHAS